MLRVGIAGIGFMGWIHYLAYQRVRGTRVTAIATRDPRKLAGDWRGIRGNFGPPGEQIDVSTMRCYQELDDLLADPELDLIDICLPPDLHAATALKALARGKHVFCEKPLALTTADCRRMVRAADRAKKLLLIGHVLPMFPEYALALRWIRSGRYGGILGGRFHRIISDPLWLPDFYNPERVGGPLVDLHVHDAHLIRLLFGMPVAVTSRGRMRGEVVEYCESLFAFDDQKLVVGATSGVIHQQGRPFLHGFEIHLERATLVFESGVIGGQGRTLMPLTLFDSKGRAQQPAVPQGDAIDAFASEIKEVASAVRTGKPSPLLGGELASDAIRLCHAQTESVRKGRTVRLR